MHTNDNTTKILTKNSIKCLVCNTILESKHRHDYVKCHCPNETSCDGGLEYQRTFAMDLDLIEILSEYMEVRNANANTERNT